MKKSLLLITLIVLTALTAKARNIWNGSEAIDWNKGKGVQIASDKFADVREGDQLVFGIVFTGNTDWPQLAPTKGDWSGNLTGSVTLTAIGLLPRNSWLLCPSMLR